MAKSDDKWLAYVRGILRAEMARRNLNYKDLRVRLAAIGVLDTEDALRTRVSRGTFSAAFFIQVLDVLGCTSIRLEDTPRDRR